MICVKRHAAGNELLVAACDSALLGRRFEEGELCLELGAGFYDGERVDRRLFLEVLTIATIANLAGEETVGAAVEAGLVDPGCVMRVGGVPHAQFLRM